MTLQIVDIAKEILKLQQDINVLILGEEREDQSWARNDPNVRTLPLLPPYCSNFP
jgi:translation initiation factor 4G